MQLLSILAHELAHLQHRDLHTLAATRLLLILLWPQPLYWLLRRTIRLDQETLADAAAADRAGRLDYAQQLLAWASTAGTQRPPRLAGAVGLWEGPSQLKRRIAVLLNEKFNVMRSCSRRWRGGSLAAVALMAIGLSTITLQPQAGIADEAGDETAKVESPATDKVESTTEIAIVGAAASDSSARGETAISGRIVMEDGSPASVKGQLEYLSARPGSSYMGTAGQFADTFGVKCPPGTVWLIYFADGFSPARIGPLQADGQPIDDVEIRLKPGFSIPIEVMNENGQPIPGANISVQPIIGNGSSAPTVERLTDDRGRYLFRHVANFPYAVTVTAPTYAPLRIASKEFQPDKPARFALTPTPPTTGVIQNADGSPAAGAVLQRWYENFDGGGRSEHGVAAVADEQGRFTLDQLTIDSSHLFIIETKEKSRILSPELAAGIQDVLIRVPARRDLKGRVLGDLATLPHRNGQPFVHVHQELKYEFNRNRHSVSRPAGGDALVTPINEGGEFAYEGLFPGDVAVSAGEFKTTVAVNEQGVTEVVLQVSPKKDAAPTSARPAAETTHKALNAEDFSITGRCIDEAGQPVPNARLWFPLRPEFLDYGATLETVADDAGQFAFQIPAELRGPSAALQLSMIYAYEPAHAVGIASAYEQLKSGDLSAVEVKLSNSAMTTYRILDPGGDPVADARVEPWHIPAGGIYPVALQRLLEETSDALGIVKLRGMRESDIRSVRVHHAVWGAQEFSELNNRRSASNNDLRMKLVGGIAGRVQTDGGGPVAGIPVYASTETELSQFRGEPTGYATTVTDADGRFEMPAIATGSGKLSFYVDQDQPWRVRPSGRFTVRADEVVEQIVPLERAVRAKGIMRTADTRAPVPHAQVHLRHGDLTGNNWMTEQMITDEEGRFEAFVLPGEIRMYIQQKPAEFDPWECTEERRKTPIVVPNGSDTFDLPPIELERTKAVEGLIVDHNDQPLPNARLYVTESNYIYGNTTSDEEGRFVMQLPPSVTIEEYVVRTNDSRDRHVLEVVSESPLKLRTPAPSFRQDADNRDKENAE